MLATPIQIMKFQLPISQIQSEHLQVQLSHALSYYDIYVHRGLHIHRDYNFQVIKSCFRVRLSSEIIAKQIISPTGNSQYGLCLIESSSVIQSYQRCPLQESHMLTYNKNCILQLGKYSSYYYGVFIVGKVDGWSCCQENMPVISRRKVILGLILSLIIVIQLLTNSYNASTVNHSLLHKTQHSLTKVQYNNLLSLFSTQCIIGYSLTHPITVIPHLVVTRYRRYTTR